MFLIVELMIMLGERGTTSPEASDLIDAGLFVPIRFMIFMWPVTACAVMGGLFLICAGSESKSGLMVFFGYGIFSAYWLCCVKLAVECID